ncbi:WD40-repeat-containing domain protein [Amanita muscaria]
MAKHPRKRQKLSKDDSRTRKNKHVDEVSQRVLGDDPLIGDDAEKDDEERRLESMLFGTKFVPRDVPDTAFLASSDGESADEGQEGETGEGQLQHLADSDLFFIDDGAPAPVHDASPGAEQSEDQDEEDEEEQESRKSLKPTKSKPKARQAAWTDPSDEPLTISIAHSHKRLRKLRDAPDEDVLTGKEYESRLRRQFERINPEPTWASKARKTARQRKKGKVLGYESQESESEEEEDEEGEDMLDLVNTSAGILATGKRRTAAGNVILPPEQIAIERLRDANQSVQQSNGGQVKVVAFHPSDKVPVLCVGTTDRRIRLFNVDGHTSPLLQTLHVPSLPITSQTSAQFHPSGSSILLAGSRPYFFTHDLQSGVTKRHSRGLWGTTFSAISDTTAALLSSSSNSHKRTRSTFSSKSTFGLDEESGKKGDNNSKSRGGGEGMDLTAFSPYPGDILAVAGRGGHVHFVDWKSGSGQVVASVKCGASGGGVKGLWWVPPTQSLSPFGSLHEEASSTSSRPHLAVLSGDAEVYLWDVGTRRCVRRWKDEGGFRGAGKVMAGAIGHGGDGWLAIGSNSGLVNVYGADSFSHDAELTQNPKPLKSVANLVTPISTLRFNHDAQLLAIASQEKKDAMRLIHLPSLTSFANWPTSSTPLGHVTAVDFSARSEYIAIGNTRGRVLLYHLRDYGAGATGGAL